MFYLGKTNGRPLVTEPFEAWDFGPVIPEVYHHVKGFGSGPIRNVFHWIDPVDQSSDEFATLKEAAEGTKFKSAAQLVANTHWHNGAWARVYKPRMAGVIIPNSIILEEYRERAAA